MWFRQWVTNLVKKIVTQKPFFTNNRQYGQLSHYSDSLRVGRSEDRIPVGAIFSTHIQTSPGAHGSFPGVKQPGRGVDHPPDLEMGLKKEQGYTSTPTLCLHGTLQSELHLQFSAYVLLSYTRFVIKTSLEAYLKCQTPL